MSLNRIHLFLKRALLIVFSIVVMAGATGLSFKAHYCHGSLSGIAFYTELGIQKPVSCGCKEDLFCAKSQSTKSVLVSISKKSCCSNISIYKKLNFEILANTKLISVLVLPCLNFFIFNNNPQIVNEVENTSVSDFRFKPPPRAGRLLVLFLSQLRIPLIIYNC
jgi:hypothetical protein